MQVAFFAFFCIFCFCPKLHFFCIFLHFFAFFSDFCSWHDSNYNLFPLPGGFDTFSAWAEKVFLRQGVDYFGDLTMFSTEMAHNVDLVDNDDMADVLNEVCL